MSDEVPSSYRARLAELENELGRDVCGYPDEEGRPCEQWPADQEGRCARHAGRCLDDAFREDDRRSPDPVPTNSPSVPPAEEGEPDARDTDGSRLLDAPARSVSYWMLLVVFGLLSGGGTGAVLFEGGTTPDARTSESVSINLNNPDFTRIRDHYRNGDLGEVGSELRRIHRHARHSSDRAQALYYRYVLQQNRGNHQRAFELATNFLNTFKDHPLRAEVTFGAWFLADRFLGDRELAQRYKEQLNSEFPDSKWAQQTDS